MDDSVTTGTTVPAATTPTSMSVTEVTGLVQLFNNSLLAMEGRLSAKMDDNSRAASERWVKHDHDAERILSDLEKRFIKVEAALEKRSCDIQRVLEVHIAEAKDRWGKEHDTQLVIEARLKPVAGAVAYVRRNWKTILLVIVSILSVIGFSQTTLRGVLDALNL